MGLTKQQVREKAAELGIDLVGFCEWPGLEREAPDYDKPAAISTYFPTLLVLVKRYASGVACSPDEAFRQYTTGRTARHLEEEAAELAYWLENRDAIAALLSALIPDLRRQPVSYGCPAGQGSLLLRRAAVACGLGSLGLNEMLLTPQFGPRIFLSGILTDLEAEPDPPFTEELCPGLEECGRCAAVCPEEAIPRVARRGAPLEEVRGLDAEACSRSCHPYGPDRMVEHLKELFATETAEGGMEVARDPTTQKLWFNMTVLRQGSFTGCQRCELVCPVGDDYPVLERSAARRADLPEDFAPVVEGNLVRVESAATVESEG